MRMLFLITKSDPQSVEKNTLTPNSTAVSENIVFCSTVTLGAQIYTPA